MSVENAIKHLKVRNFTGHQLDMAIKSLEKEIPQKVIKIKGVSSQACPVCRNNVNWKYCSNCGQRIEY